MFGSHESAHESKDPYFDSNVGLMRAVLLLRLAGAYLSPAWEKVCFRFWQELLALGIEGAWFQVSAVLQTEIASR